MSSNQCPNCDSEGKTNDREVAYVCQNTECRVTAFTMQAVNA